MSCASRRLFFATLVVLWSAAFANGQRGAAPTELEGVWEGVQSTVGDKTRTFKAGEVRLTFRGDILTAVGLVEPRGQEVTVPFVLNPDITPKVFDYKRPSGQVMPCIYELNGTTLTIAVPRSSGRLQHPAKIDPSSEEMIVLTLRGR